MSQPVIAVMAQYPEFIKPPNEVNLIGVNGGKVECEIFGVPKPKVTWFKDYHPYKETYRVQAYHYPPQVKFIYSEMAKKFCEIFPLYCIVLYICYYPKHI